MKVPIRIKDKTQVNRAIDILKNQSENKVKKPVGISPVGQNTTTPSKAKKSVDKDKKGQPDKNLIPSQNIVVSKQESNALTEVNALFDDDNPLITLARSINMSFDLDKVNSGDFSELTDLFIKSAFFNNATMIQQLPMLFGRNIRLTHFINLIEDDLFDPNKYPYLTNDQKIILLAHISKAQAGITQSISRNSSTIIQGMEVLPKLSAFAEELHKKKVMEVPDETDGKASAILKMIRQKIVEKAKERQGGDEE